MNKKKTVEKKEGDKAKTYFDLFKKNNSNELDTNKIERAYSVALDMKKFELDLYWKRANYYFIFITATLTGIYFVSKEGFENKDILTLSLSILGLIVSLGWLAANRGSKFWIENWEKHVDMLEDMYNGPLYKSVFTYEKYRLYKISSAYPFSVTKINHIISFAVSIIFFFLNIVFFQQLIINSVTSKCFSFIIGIGFSLMIYMFIVYIYRTFCRNISARAKIDDGLDSEIINVNQYVKLSKRVYEKD